MYFDWSYVIYIMIPTLILSFATQMYLKNTYAKWSKVRNGAGVTGEQTTDALFSRTSLSPIPVQQIPGALTDHFDPGKNIVALSQPIYSQPSVASMAVSAHELGHVQQYQSGSALIKARGFLLPALRFSPTLSYFAIFFGFLLNMTGLVWLGIAFFSLMVLFTILTLPVEFDASKRGLAMLSEAGLMVTEEDRQGSKAVLRAAALTYVAAAITSVLQLLYYISLANRRR